MLWPVLPSFFQELASIFWTTTLANVTLALRANIVMWSSEIAVKLHAFQEFAVSKKPTQYYVNLARVDLLETEKIAKVL